MVIALVKQGGSAEEDSPADTPPDYKEIPLTNSDFFTLVDSRDYDYLMQWKWSAIKGANKKLYAKRHYRPHHQYYLHKEIANLFADDVSSVRHLNGNTLDNRRRNLELDIKKRRTQRLVGTNAALTAREKEIARLTSLGLTSPQIAQKLYLGTRTIETHLNNLFKKLGVNNRYELVHIALNGSLQDPRPDVKSLDLKLPILKGRIKEINRLKTQRLMTAQLVTESMNAIALQISQLQQIHANLEQTLKIMEP